jgi:hypothetical protein
MNLPGTESHLAKAGFANKGRRILKTKRVAALNYFYLFVIAHGGSAGQGFCAAGASGICSPPVPGAVSAAMLLPHTPFCH